MLEEVRVGAVLKAEALPSDVNAWVDKAQRHRVRQGNTLSQPFISPDMDVDRLP